MSDATSDNENGKQVAGPDTAEVRELMELFVALPQFDRDVLLSTARTLLAARSLETRH